MSGNPSAADDLPSVQITVQCKNPTEHPLSDVLQVYVHVNGSSDEVPNHKLVAFERIRLEAGESKELQIPVPAAAFTTVDDSGERKYDGTSATLYLGFSQPELTESGQKFYPDDRGLTFDVAF